MIHRLRTNNNRNTMEKSKCCRLLVPTQMITSTCMTRFFYSCFPILIRIVGCCNNAERTHTPPSPHTQDKWKKYGHKHMVDWLISKWIHLLVFVMLFNSVGELTTQFCSWSHSDLLNSFTESQDTIYYSWPLWEYANMCV